MAITVRSGTVQIADGAGTGNRNLTLPSGAVAGDKVLLFYFNAVSTSAWTGAPTGFTEQVNTNFSGHGQLCVASYNSTLSSGDISTGYLTVNIQTSTNAVAVALVAFTGWNTTTLMDATPTTRAVTSDFVSPSVIEIPAITTTTDLSMVFVVATTRSTTPAWSSKPTCTEVLAGSNGTYDANLWIGAHEITPAGTHAATSVTSAGVQYEVSAALAVKAEPAAPSGQPMLYTITKLLQ